MEPRPRKPQLSVLQRRHVERAREVAAASAQSIAADYDRIDPDDPDQAYPYALGVTRSVVGSLLDIIGDLTGEPELDAKLSPPAALSDAERDEAVMPPGHQLPAGKVPGHFPAECGRTNAHFPHGACGGTVPRDGEHVESVQAFGDAAAGTDAR